MFTAAGFPVLSAIAYGNPVNTSPQKRRERDERDEAGDAGLEANPGDEAEDDDGTDERGDQHDVGDHHPEQQREPPDRREQQPVEVAVLDVGDDDAGARDPGDAEDDRRRELERLVVEAGRHGVGEVRERADVHEVEEDRDDERRQRRTPGRA